MAQYTQDITTKLGLLRHLLAPLKVANFPWNQLFSGSSNHNSRKSNGWK